LSEIIDFLIEDGFWHWIVNNPGHIGLLRGRKVRILAGPYLYTFNRWAVSWLAAQNITHFITPFENSRQNLEKTIDENHRKQSFVTLFAYPTLFRMRFHLPTDYDFLYFTDKENTVFKAMDTPDGSYVLPENPFSIIDKIGFLKSAGFSHFIIDLSKTIVRKNEFRQIMTALEKEALLPETERFNWKDGFYSPEEMEERKSYNEFRASKEAAGEGKFRSDGKFKPRKDYSHSRNGNNSGRKDFQKNGKFRKK
jgi:putative protease